MLLTVREATLADRQQLASLIHFEAYVHRHLDWRAPLDWISSAPFFVAEEREKITGALACPPDKPEIAWIRLFAAGSGVPVGETWQALWESSQAALKQMGETDIAVIVLQGWFRSLLEGSGFFHANDVVTLMWEEGNTLPAPQPIPGVIRKMQTGDLEAVFALDSMAFEREWRNSASALQSAFEQAALATVMVDGENVLGYQISTSSMAGGHLARLAVHPGMQHLGIGYALVHGVVEEFRQRGVNHVTVNTQRDNQASLAVYNRAGFQQMEETYQVYHNRIE